ncbi:hypothetical protein TD95_002929 [Thielaviopsis punctulata]|uniref:Uncharacterized protein n=1 Tax=Thielaviopsis punctulata TaxID=72032 RepID=A0A0F4Z800_9PEZI|nr:hypothetical protein TD95_002929 [Thielaviopsis punctulata]
MSPSARLQANQPSANGARSDPKPAEDISTSQPAPRKPTTRGSRSTRGRARGGRGRGRGGRQSTTRSNGVGQARSRRGRIKQFDDAKVQAAYERSREVKDYWNLMVYVGRSALADLAQRNLDKLTEEPNAHEMTPEYLVIMEQLGERFAKAIEVANVEFHSRTAVLEEALEHQRYVLEEQYKNAVEDLEEVFIDGQLNRLRILEELHDHGLPVDTEDLEHVFKPITAEQYKDFEPFVDYDEEGHVVPYPSRVPGTFMYQKAQDFQRQYKAEKAAATQAAQEARLQARAQAQLDEAESSSRRKGQGNGSGSGTKRSARNSTRNGGRNNAAANNNAAAKSSATAASGPNDEGADNDEEPATARHPMGILGGVEEGAAVSASPAPDQEPEAEVGEEVATTTNSELPVRERSPPPPNGMQTPDEHGAAIVVSRGKGHNRIMLRPPPYKVDDIEIGFRDSTNDPTRGSNVAANRGKYAGTPHTGSIHIDPMLWNYDARVNKKGDLDEDLVEKYKVHPTFGFFLHSSRNEKPVSEDRREDVDRGRPVVYLPPSGEIVSACRSTAAFVAEKVDDARKGTEVSVALKAFCDAEGITEDDIAPDADESIPLELTGSSLRYPSLRGDRVAMRNFLAKQTIKFQEVSSVCKDEETRNVSNAASTEGGQADSQLLEEQQSLDVAQQFLDPLVQATILASAKDLAEDASEQRSSYDAIRDVFRPSAPEPPRRDAGMALLTLAAACDTAPRVFEASSSASAPAPPHPMQHQFVHHQPMMGYEMPPGSSGYGAPSLGPSGPYDQSAPMGVSHGASPADYYQQQSPMGQYGQMGSQGYQQQTMLGPQSSPLPPLRPALQGEASPRPEEQSVSGGYYPPSSAVAHSGYHYPAPTMEHMASQQAQHSQMPMSSLPSSGPGYFQGQTPSYGSSIPYDPSMSQQMVVTPPSRDRSGSTATLPPPPPPGPVSGNSAAKYRKLEPAPVPKHRRGWTTEPQLRTVGYDPSNDIKDYAANEPLPGRAPPYIRAWSHNSTGVRRRHSKKDSERRDAE